MTDKKDAVVRLQEKLDRLQEKYLLRGRQLDAALSKLEHVEAQLRAEREAERHRARRQSYGTATRAYYKNGG